MADRGENCANFDIEMHKEYKSQQQQQQQLVSDDGESSMPRLMEQVLTILSIIFLVITFPLTIWNSVVVVPQYQRSVVLRLGRLREDCGGILGPGVWIVLPFIDKCYPVDMRTLSFSMTKQDILSKDSVTIVLDAVVFFKIVDAKAAVLNVAECMNSTQMLAFSTLRNVLGTKKYCEILAERESIGHMIESALAETTANWGVRVQRVEIRDAYLPEHMRRAMAAEAEATQEARAKVISAEGEHKASEALRDAARVLESSPLAIQLRYLETLNTIAAEKNSTIVFPLPIELIGGLLGKSSPLQKMFAAPVAESNSLEAKA